MLKRCVAACQAVRVTLLVDLVGVHRLHSAFAWCLLATGASLLVGAPLGGLLIDLSGEYVHTFCLSGVCLLVAALLGTPLGFLAKREGVRRRAMHTR